ncbi:dihydrodipicolinate reductase [Lachnospiraceae bacterium RM5]|nr:dihydrodipicolinate reductase [Lachnospiraceae bacterium RM5]
MVNVIMHGCNGRMGQAITKLAKNEENLTIVAGIDVVDNIDNGYPVYKDINNCDINADVVIDFTNSKAVDKLLDFCEENSMPVVLCSTGLTDEQIERIDELSKKIAILRSGNMSLGINTLIKLLEKITKPLNEAGFDIEIVEKHHNKKLDAPSGTAMMLAETVNNQLNNEMEFVYDRSDVRKERDKKEVGISAIRGGTIVGDHDVIFAGEDEVVTISHRAYSRNVFAKGAISAAKFLFDKKNGLYTMSDVID